MTSNEIELDKKNKKGVFYGSFIVIGAWITYFVCSVPQSYCSSVLLAKIVIDYQMSDSLIGLCNSTNFFVMALGCGLAAPVIQKKGFRYSIMLGSLMGVIAYLLMAFFYTNASILILAFVFTGLCGGFGALTASVGIVNAWYERNKALPVSVLLTAGSIGGFTMPVITQLVCDHFGIKASFFMCIGMAVFSFLIAMLVLKDKPEDVGEIRDGYEWVKRHPLKETMKKEVVDQEPVSMKECFHSGRFYVIVTQSFFGKAVNAAMSSYVVLYAIRLGTTPMKAALLLTFYNVFSLCGRMSPSVIIRPRFTKKMALLLCTMFQVIGMLILFLASGYAFLAVGASITGLGFGMQVTLWPLINSECFTDENFPAINSAFNSLSTMGSGVAPMLVYMIANAMGDYSYAFAAVSLSMAFCFVLVFFTPLTRISAEKAS